MAIRRKRITLTNILAEMDGRVRSTELRQIKSGATSAVEASSATTPSTGIGTVVDDNSPCDFRKIIGGKYYSKRVTGAVDQVEIYLNSDTDAYSDDTVSLSGVHAAYDVSGSYVVTSINPAGVDRPSWLEALPVGVTSSILFSAGKDTPDSAAVDLVTRYQVASFSTNGTVTDGVITFTGAHTFAIGDIVDTSELPSPYDGLDGIFRVTAVTSNTITYKFTADLADPINSDTPTADTYVYATVQKKIAIADTWIDTSTSPSTTYYWDGLRWTQSQSAATTGVSDTLAPNVVTNIQSTTSAYTIDGGVARSSVTLTWEAPTTNSDDTAITDLAGYEIWTSYIEPDVNGDSTWIDKSGVLSADLTATFTNLNQNVDVYFKVFAVDSSLNHSDGVIYTTTTGILALELAPPTAPILESRLGSVTVSWNGLQKNPDTTESNPPLSIRTIEVHASTSDGFTPDATTLKAVMLGTSANYAIVDGLDYEDGLGGSQDWFFKLVAVDVNGNKTAGSAQRTINVSRVDNTDITAGTITANRLDVGSVGAGLVSANVLRATNLANTAGFELNGNYFRAFSPTLGNTFLVNALSGVTTIGENTVISGNSISTGTINASLITAGNLNAGAITVSNLSANAITTGTLNASNVTVTNLNAVSITSGTMSGDRITAGTLTADKLDATTRIRLGDSNSTNPTNYVEMGYVTLPQTGVSAPGFLGQYGGYKSFYIGGWNDGYNSSGFSLGVVSTSGQISDVLSVSGYDNGLGYAGNLSLDSKSITIASHGGSASDSAQGDLTLSTSDSWGSIVLNPNNNIDLQGREGAVRVNGRFRIATGGDMTASSNLHAFQIGDSTGVNLRIDNNEIAGYSAGSAEGIYIQQDGGNVRLGNVARGMGVNNDIPYANGVYANTLTTSYRSVYVSNTLTYNQLGYVASSRRYKKNIEPLNLTAEQVLSVAPVQYHYNEEDDTAQKHPGMIAEDMHDAGLGGYVSYDDEGLPQTITYEFYVSALQLVARHHDQQIKELTARITALESK